MIKRPELRPLTIFGLNVHNLPVEDILLFAEFQALGVGIRHDELRTYFAELAKLHIRVGKR